MLAALPDVRTVANIQNVSSKTTLAKHPHILHLLNKEYLKMRRRRRHVLVAYVKNIKHENPGPLKASGKYLKNLIIFFTVGQIIVQK